MGGGQSKRALSQRHHRRRRPPTYLQFEDFEILRSIGRGTYGKVCLVERKAIWHCIVSVADVSEVNLLLYDIRPHNPPDLHPNQSTNFPELSC